MGQLYTLLDEMGLDEMAWHLDIMGLDILGLDILGMTLYDSTTLYVYRQEWMSVKEHSTYINQLLSNQGLEHMSIYGHNC